MPKKVFCVIAFLGYCPCVMGCVRVICGGDIEISLRLGRAFLALRLAGGLFAEYTCGHATRGTLSQQQPDLIQVFSSLLIRSVLVPSCCLKRRETKSPLHARVRVHPLVPCAGLDPRFWASKWQWGTPFPHSTRSMTILTGLPLAELSITVYERKIWK